MFPVADSASVANCKNYNKIVGNTDFSDTVYLFFEEHDGFLPKNEWISMNGPHVVLIRGQNFWAH